MIARALAAVPLAWALACAGSSLEGSVGEQIPLGFDAVEVQRSGSAIALLYLRSLPEGGGRDVMLKVAANTSGLDLSQPLQIDLVQPLGASVRGSLSRAVTDDPRRDFGPLYRGFLRFDDVPDVGADVSGQFSLVLEQGAGLCAGKSAFGDFHATVVEAGR